VRMILVTGLMLMVAAACSTRSNTVTPPMPPPREGRSTFRVLSEPAAPAEAHEVDVTIVPVAPGPENQLPPYPADALKAGCSHGAVATRVYIGLLGRVVKQLPVPGRSTPSDSCHASFSKSVAETVERWGFFPALRQTCVPQKDAPPRCSSVPIESYVDLEFQFKVVDGQPSVRPR
jgi:hypothetical protein